MPLFTPIGGGGGISKATVTGTTGSPSVDTTSRAGKTIYKFTGSGTITIGTPGTCEILVIGGGGAGSFMGGGGAGAFLEDTSAFLKSGTYTVTRGAGGVGDVPTSPNVGLPGETSSIGPYYALGGGGGGSSYSNINSLGQYGGNGGSGGGAAVYENSSGYSLRGGTALNPNLGNDGGGCYSGGTSGAQSGGGGGGAGGAGGSGGTNAGGNGGAGKASSITGTSVTYAGGGAGCGNNSAGSPGSGGGGIAGTSTAGTGGNGDANTGSGGGGSRSSGGVGRNGGSGGSGIVIVVVG